MFYVLLVSVFVSGFISAGKEWSVLSVILLFICLALFALYVDERYKGKKNKQEARTVPVFTEQELPEFATPLSVEPGTYGVRNKYGLNNETLFINFKLYNPDDVDRIRYAIEHISRMMTLGRPCYVRLEGVFELGLITRVGFRSTTITYIDKGSTVTRSAIEIDIVLICPQPHQN